jgi:hypothetical protein
LFAAGLSHYASRRLVNQSSPQGQTPRIGEVHSLIS